MTMEELDSHYRFDRSQYRLNPLCSYFREALLNLNYKFLKVLFSENEERTDEHWLSYRSIKSRAIENPSWGVSSKFLDSLDDFRGKLNSAIDAGILKVAPSLREEFITHAEYLTARFREEAQGSEWISPLVQQHFEAFGWHPIEKAILDATTSAHLFYDLTELRDRAFREPSERRINEYLEECRRIELQEEYNRTGKLIAEEEGRPNRAVEPVEDEIQVALMCHEAGLVG